MNLMHILFPKDFRCQLTAAVIDPVQWPEFLAYASEYKEWCILADSINNQEQVKVLPYCINLLPDDDVSGIVLENIANECGIALQALDGKDFQALAAHLKTLSTALLHDGRRVFFRYYDPVFLKCLLDSANQDQLSYLYSNVIDRFVIPLSRSTEPAVYVRPEGLPEKKETMLCINEKQYHGLFEAQYDKYVEMLTDHFYHTVETKMPWETFHGHIAEAARQAEQCGCSSRNDIFCFVALGAENGWKVYEHNDLRAILERADMNPDDKIDLANKLLNSRKKQSGRGGRV